MSKEYNEEVRLQNLKEFVDEYANEEELTSIYGVRATIDIIEEQLNNYKKLLNANPSEALECLEEMWELSCDSRKPEYTLYEIIKQALLKAQEQEKVLNEALKLNGEWAEELDYYRDLQEPKNYLKWEDLDFGDKSKEMIVRMGDNVYKMTYRLYENEGVIRLEDCQRIYLELFANEKKFFNDLRLERVEE